jgi:lysophospholipase L1-like esterase
VTGRRGFGGVGAAIIPVSFAAALLAAGTAFGDPAGGVGTVVAVRCPSPAALVRIEPELGRVATHLAAHRPIKIIAIGSSSTEGVGATASGLSYPSQLERDLRVRLPGAEIQVLNRGKGGEDAGEELARLGRDVLAEHPDLVIWQVGTNAVLRRDDLAADAELLQRGIEQIVAAGADVVLMDLQYAPRVLARPAYALMEQVIADTAERDHVALFRRFEMMRYWQTEPAAVPATIGGDGLHMNDIGYGCLAAALADALVANWSAEVKSATRHPATASPSGMAADRPNVTGTASLR